MLLRFNRVVVFRKNKIVKLNVFWKVSGGLWNNSSAKRHGMASNGTIFLINWCRPKPLVYWVSNHNGTIFTVLLRNSES